MDNLVFSGHNRTYDDFKKQLVPEIKPLFDSLRDYCFSLGKDVIEDVRMHRIVFCKSMTFRFFADMEPQQDSILIKIRRDRKEPQKEVQVKPGQDLNEIKNLLCDAYNTIR
jgi:predicted transport protein